MPNWLANDQDSTILVYLATSEDLYPNSCTTFHDLFLFSSLFFCGLSNFTFIESYYIHNRR